MDDVIFKLGPNKVTEIITDNEPKINLLANEVQNKYKHIVKVGCVSHKLSMMIRHICNLSQFKVLIKGTREIIREINDHHKLHAKYREAIESDGHGNFGELSLFSETRFAGSVLMMNTLIKAINPLKLIVSDSSNDVTDETKMKLLSYGQRKDFVSDMKQLVTILQPAADCIHRIEGNSESIADMIEQVMMMSHIHNASLQNISVQGEEVKTSFKKYISNSKTPSALLANMLHPLYLGSKQSSNDRSKAISFLVAFIGQLDMIDSKKDILKSYQEFYTKEGYFSQDFIWSLDLTNASSWWKMIRYQSDHKQLADIALRLLHVQPTNTTVERSFSSQNFIYRKEGNRLSAQHVHELLSVYCNINTFDNDATFQPDDIILESDDEENGK